MTFFSTGNSDLNGMLGGGIVPGRISVIRAEVGSGKSMLLENILSNVSCPVLHFLSEADVPKFVSVEKDDYTFFAMDNVDDIKDKITSSWMNGFSGLIAIDNIDRLNFGEFIDNPGVAAKMLKEWLFWFVNNSQQHPEQSRLEFNNCAMLYTKSIKRQDNNGLKILIDGGSGESYLSSQVIDVQINHDKQTVVVSVSKNKFAPLPKNKIELDFGKNGIK